MEIDKVLKKLCRLLTEKGYSYDYKIIKKEVEAYFYIGKKQGFSFESSDIVDYLLSSLIAHNIVKKEKDSLSEVSEFLSNAFYAACCNEEEYGDTRIAQEYEKLGNFFEAISRENSYYFNDIGVITADKGTFKKLEDIFLAASLYFKAANMLTKAELAQKAYEKLSIVLYSDEEGEQ